MADNLVVIDTSAWIHALRRPPHPVFHRRVAGLLRDGRAAIVPPVRVELLGGMRTEAERRRLAQRLDGVAAIPFTEADWEQASEWMFTLRRRGVTLPMVDLLIAAPAYRIGALLLHDDDHFSALATHAGLKAESPTHGR